MLLLQLLAAAHIRERYQKENNCQSDEEQVQHLSASFTNCPSCDRTTTPNQASQCSVLSLESPAVQLGRTVDLKSRAGIQLVREIHRQICTQQLSCVPLVPA